MSGSAGERPTRERCRHDGDVEVHEYAEGFNATIVRDGRQIAWNAADPEPSHRGFVTCLDCGRLVDYTHNRSRLPAWARRAIDIAERPIYA